MQPEEHAWIQDNELLRNRCRNMEKELADLKQLVGEWFKAFEHPRYDHKRDEEITKKLKRAIED